MKKAKKNIQVISKTIFIAFLILAGFMIIPSVIRTNALFGDYQPADFVNNIVLTVQNYLLIVLLIYTAFVFRLISKAETPFTKSVSNRMKLIAVLMFMALAVPKWVWYLADSVSNQTLNFTLFDSTIITALVLSGAVYCFALIFDYGCIIQDENNEIL